MSAADRIEFIQQALSYGWISEDGAKRILGYGVLNPCEHEPVQTGMAKSWCKHCDVNMRFKDGAYQVEE